MITIGELMKIDQGRQDRSIAYSVSLVKVYHELRKKSVLEKFKAFIGGKSLVNSYNIIFKFSVTSGKGHTYVVLIKTNPDFDLTKWETNPCMIYCSCPDFKFRSAYILNQRGGLLVNEKIKVELGQALSDKPKRTPSLLCKHSYAALSWLVDNYDTLMKTI